MDSRSSLRVVQCRQFDPVSRTLSMNNGHRNGSPSVYSITSKKHLVPVKSRDTYFKKGSEDNKRLILVLCFLTATLLVTVIVLSVLYARANRSLNFCDSEDCVRIAASLKESMDTSVDPCDDFYKHVCGRWHEEHPTPDTSLTNSWFNERTEHVTRTIRELLRKNHTEETPWAVRQVKKLYTSCNDIEAMNLLGLSPLFDLLEELGLPRIPAMLTEKTGDYLRQLAEVKRVIGKDIFFGLEVFPDPRNKSINIIALSMPTTNSPLPIDKELNKRLQMVKKRLRKARISSPEEEEEDKEEADEGEKPNFSAEKIYMTGVIKEVLGNGTAKLCDANKSSFPSDEEVKKVVDEIYQLSKMIYYLSPDDDNNTVMEEDLSENDYMLVNDLQKLTDEHVVEINETLTPKKIWRPFLEHLLRNISDLDLDGRDKLLVGDLQYLKGVALLLSAMDDAILETVIWWAVVDTVVPHSSENLRREWNDYLSVLTDAEVGESRSLHCAMTANQLMGMAVSWLFVDRSFHEEKGPKVVEMLENIRAAFASLVGKADWMDRHTKISTLRKTKKMTSVIGYPKWLFDEGEIDDYYAGIDLSESAYLGNMLQIIRLRSAYEIMSLRETNLSNETFWATDPTDVNAFHTFQANQITVPVGILQFPFYELGLEALNYGAIGTVLGHELTHGFDNSGRQYDSEGNLRQWWTNETIVEYTQRTRCFVNHYSEYYEEEVDDYVDGELTLGENIADNGGLREAVLAYRRWVARHGREPLLPGFTHLTHEQLLFLGFAHLWCESYTPSSLRWMLMDSHCPGHVRLLGVLRNSVEFSDAWSCPAGSPMNPKKKCRLW